MRSIRENIQGLRDQRDRLAAAWLSPKGRGGQTMVEWILIIGIVATILVAVLEPLRTAVTDAITTLAAKIKELFTF